MQLFEVTFEDLQKDFIDFVKLPQDENGLFVDHINKVSIWFVDIKKHTQSNGYDKSVIPTMHRKQRELGYKMLQIYSHEWENAKIPTQNIINTALHRSPIGIGARKLEIKVVDQTHSKLFFDKFHVQGKNMSGDTYGAYYGTELVAAMNFGRPYRPTGYQWDLRRYATNGKVYSGAAQRIFKHFIKTANPDDVVSYSDNRWFDGGIYGHLGFTFEEEYPCDMEFTDGKKVYAKAIFRTGPIYKKFGIKCNYTERPAVMLSLGYDILWNSGKKRWVWRK